MASHLTLSERRIIAGMLQRKISVAQIAAQLGRHRSTIHREIGRNFWHDVEVPMATGYWHMNAQHLADGRRKRQAKLLQDDDLRGGVIAGLMIFGFLGVRAALFWSALLGAPIALTLALAGAAVEAAAGPGVLRWLAYPGYAGLGFWLWLVAANLAEAEGFDATGRVVAVLAAVVASLALGLEALTGAAPASLLLRPKRY